MKNSSKQAQEMREEQEEADRQSAKGQEEDPQQQWRSQLERQAIEIEEEKRLLAERTKSDKESATISNTLESKVKQQELLEHSCEAINAFLSSVTHDLKSPLTSIIGSTQLLQRRVEKYAPEESEKYLQSLGVISVSTRSMATMIEDLLDLARLQMGLELELDQEEGDLIEVIQRIVREQKQSISKHQLTIQTDQCALVARYDISRIERVLANLLSNAIKYSPRGGEISISISREEAGEESWAKIILKDQGIGIPEADLPFIFEPFHHVSNNERRIQGTGLGLTSAAQIIEQHGGSISVASEEGRGTTFTIRLPIQREMLEQ